MDRWVTDFIDRYFINAPTADSLISTPTAESLRVIMLLAEVVQAASVVAGVVLLWHAIDCGLTQHHGHAIVCTVEVAIAIASFDIAAKTWERAQTANTNVRPQ